MLLNMTNETIEIIKRRRSIRDFQPVQIKNEELTAITEAGLYAPNGGGETWHFTVIQNHEILNRLDRLAKKFASTCGISWLEQFGKDENFNSMYHAPTIILISCDENSITAVYDASAATENILIAAESLGIGACWGYFVTQAFLTDEGGNLHKELKIPTDYKVYTSIMLGYKNGETPLIQPRKPGLVTYIK